MTTDFKRKSRSKHDMSRWGRFQSVVFFTVSLFVLFVLVSVAAAPKVKVEVADEGAPSLDLLPLKNEESLLASITCESPEYIKTYGGEATYNERNRKTAICLSGYMQGDLIATQITLVQASIDVLKNSLESMAKTAEYLNGLVSIDGLEIYALPAGLDLSKSLDKAEKIQMMCVRDSTGFIPRVAVGDLSFVNGRFFDRIPDEQMLLIQELNAQNVETYDSITKEVEKNGKLSFGSIKRLVGRMSALQKELAKSFMPITAEDLLSGNQQDFLGVPDSGMSLKVKLFMLNGGYLACDLPGAVTVLLKIFGINEPLLEAVVYLNGLEYGACLPQMKMLNTMKESVRDQAERFSRLKINYEAVLKELEKKKSELEAKDYYCEK